MYNMYVYTTFKEKNYAFLYINAKQHKVNDFPSHYEQTELHDVEDLKNRQSGHIMNNS